MIKEFFEGARNKTRLNQRAIVFITCLIIAVVFWFITSMSRVYETVITIPVSYVNLPFTKHIEGDLPPDLSFYFRGTGFELFGMHLRNHPDSIVVDLNAAMGKNGQINIPSDSLKNQFPGDLKALKITPEYIAPGIASRLGKRVPVVLQSRFSFRERFRPSGNIILRPDSIDIAGPEELLAKIHSVSTEAAVLSDIHKDHFGGIELAKNLPKGVHLSQPYIHYFIPVVEYTEGFVEIPVEIPASMRQKVNLLPSVVKITYLVELGRFNQIKPEDFVAYVDMPGAKLPPSLEVKLKRHPARLVNIRIDPQFVDYLVKE